MAAIRERDLDNASWDARVHGMEFTRPSTMKPKVDSKTQEHLDEYLKRRQAEKLMEVQHGG